MKFAYFLHFCYHLNKGVSVPIYVIVKGFAAMKRLSRHTVDFIISAGAACRSAYYTQRLGMRKFSSPCDWMMHYTLSDYLHVFKTGGEEMFRRTHFDPTKGGAVDEQNGMIALHDFDANLPLEHQLPDFYEKMRRRALNTITRINKSRSVGIVMYRADPFQTIVQFAESLCNLFPHTTFHLLNLKDTPDATTVEVSNTIKTKRYTLQEVCFNDEHINGREKQQNPNFWMGNTQIWSKTLCQAFQVNGRLYQIIRKDIKRRLKKATRRYNSLKAFFDRHLQN